MGQSPFAERRRKAYSGAVHATAGLELLFCTPHVGAYLWRGMDLARALSRTFAVWVAGCDPIPRCGKSARGMARTRRPSAGLRSRTIAITPRPRNGVQDAQVRHLQQPPLAIDAT